MARSAKFIVLEGIDGVGTTTHTRALYERLSQEGIGVHRSFEPSAGPIGVLLRQVLTGRLRASENARRIGASMEEGGRESGQVGPEVVAGLFASDRLDHLESELLPRLADGVTVLCDRYLLSSLAYQSIECDLEWVLALNQMARAPDLTIFLDLDAKEALGRRADRHGPEERFDALATQSKVAARYRALVAKACSYRALRSGGAGDTSGGGMEAPDFTGQNDALAKSVDPVDRVSAEELSRRLGPLMQLQAKGSIEEVGEQIWQAVRPLLTPP